MKSARGGGAAQSLFHGSTFHLLQRKQLDCTPTNLKLLSNMYSLHVFSEQPSQGLVFIHNMEFDKLKLYQTKATTHKILYPNPTKAFETKSIFDAAVVEDYIVAVAECGLFKINFMFGLYLIRILCYLLHAIFHSDTYCALPEPLMASS